MLNEANIFDAVVIGGGPGGLAAAVASEKSGLKTLIVEREERLGGILKQCIHDGFGLITFKKMLSGPEYAEEYVKLVKDRDITIYTKTFVIKSKKNDDIFTLTLSNDNEGVFNIRSRSLVLATGCRERTAKQVFIGGTRPAGVYTAGTAQHFTNIEGYLPCKKCVILGSGDIGLIMARRLTLEGAKVLGVYEAKNTPSGLSRNIVQCLDDFSIPLYLAHTVTKIFGDYRLEAVEISKVDENMKPIAGTEEIIKCDGLILSVGLIPENEIAESLGVNIDPNTKGPIVDQDFMTSVNGIFSCGNALHVNDLVDYVSESGRLTGENIFNYINEYTGGRFIPIEYKNEAFAYVVPQKINLSTNNRKAILYFRSREIKKNIKVSLLVDGKPIKEKIYLNLRPPEMERMELNLENLNLSDSSKITLVMGE